MTDKEQLEDVRETMAYIKMCESKEMHNQEQADMAKCHLIERHGDWLIKQAERVQELEEDLTKYRNGFEFQLLINNSIKKQNKRYREAIKKGINATRYTNPEVSYILAEALEGDLDERN